MGSPADLACNDERATTALPQMVVGWHARDGDKDKEFGQKAFHTFTNPYFVPDDALMTAITSAAQRGVDVTLVNSEVSDQFLVSHAERSYYEGLLKAGVKIYL